MDTTDQKATLDFPGFEVLHELGRGGMSTVYLAEQLSLRRQLALKVMSPTLESDAISKARFLQEAQIIAQLNHPNIVKIFDADFSAGRYYIAMEYAAAGSLAQRIRRGLGPEDSLQIVKCIAGALEYAHQHGFIHRDIKPSNVLFRDDLHAVLADFGIAKVIDTKSELTRTGMITGTPAYLSPEQISCRELDGRSDLYSLGVVLYEMLTGTRPYPGNDFVAIALQHLYAPTPKLPEDTAFLQPVLERMLAKTPEERFCDGKEFIRTLDTVIQTGEYGSCFEQKSTLYDNDHTRSPHATGHQISSGVTRHLNKSLTTQRNARSHATLLKKLKTIPWIGRVGIAGLLMVAMLVWIWAPWQPSSTEQLIQGMTMHANRQIAAGNVIEPKGESALAIYRDILAIDPQNEQALSALQQIAMYFQSEAETMLQNNKLPEGLALVKQGLQIYPKHEGLLALRKELNEKRKNTPTQRETAELAALADNRVAQAQRLQTGPNDAIAAYREVIKGAPGQKPSSQGLEHIAERLEQRARTKQLEGDVKGSLELVERGLMLAPEHDGLRTLHPSIRKEVKAERQRQRPAAQIEILTSHLSQRQTPASTEDQKQALLARAEQQVKRLRLTRPAGDNAYETYQQVLAMDTGNRVARKGLQRIVARYEQLARRELQIRNFDYALKLVSRGLGVEPKHPSLNSLRKRITQRLKARVQQPAELDNFLGNAKPQRETHQFISPKGDHTAGELQGNLKNPPSKTKRYRVWGNF